MKAAMLFIAFVIILPISNLYAQSKSPLKSTLPQGLTQVDVAKGNNFATNSLSAKSKVSPVLLNLYREWKQEEGSWENKAKASGYDKTLLLSADKIVIEAVAEKDANALKASLEKLGLERGAVFGRMVSGLMPIESIQRFGRLKGLKFVNAGYRPISKLGSVTSQGDIAQGTNLARNACGLDGANTIVGILSDSYDALAGANAGIASGDLPGLGNPNGFTSPVNVLEDLPPGQGIDEGRAMAEIVHDVAPGAELAFHTAFLGQASFANGIVRLATEAGAKVIVDDIIYFAEPFFQDGIVAQAADIVNGLGSTYVSSAGNNARMSYESDFRPSVDTFALGFDGSPFPISDYILHDFDPGPGVDYFQQISLPPGASSTLVFQWAQAYASICATSFGAAGDLDIFIALRDGDFNSVVIAPLQFNLAGDPVEIAGFQNGDFPVEAYILIGRDAGLPFLQEDPEKIKYVIFGDDFNIEYDTNSGTAYGHANAEGALAIGAVPYFLTPAFGFADPALEDFSSAGGIPILLDVCGNPINPEVREKPEVCGPDGANTTFFIPGLDLEGDGFPNFFGTSASAPHVAGIISLLQQADPTLSPAQIETVLTSTALDMDDPASLGFDTGFDFGTGYGMVRALEAITQISNCPPSVVSFELYNADTDQLITVLSEGDRISFDQIGSKNLAIRAVTFPEEVGSVKIKIAGDLTYERIENIEPYTSFGDRQGDFVGREFPFGNFIISATAFSEAKGQGDVGNTTTLNFVLFEEINNFSLIDATNDVELGVLSDFNIVNTGVTGTNLNLKANTDDDSRIGSIEFVLETTDISVTPTGLVLQKTENIPPFALFGDNGMTDFKDGFFAENFYLLTATPYSKRNLQGVAGIPTQLIFAVSDNGGLPNVSAFLDGNTTVNVYPNPLEGNTKDLFVQWLGSTAGDTKTTYRLINQMGEEVFKQTTDISSTGTLQHFDLQDLNLSKGVYFLRVEKAGEDPQVTRLLKN